MKEIRTILAAYEVQRAAGHPAALATVVKVSGSSYRRPGARMLITQTGETVGGVSGGCLEADVVERALRVMRERQTALVTYDTTDDDDILTGVGLGCRGIVHILIEPLFPQAPPLAFDFLTQLVRRRECGVLATVFHTGTQTTAPLGATLLRHEDGTVQSDIRDAGFAARLRADAEEVSQAGRSRTMTYDLLTGQGEIFFEYLQSPLSLLLCGAGQDAGSLVRIAAELGWHVTVADHRPAFAVPERFPEAEAVLLATPDDLCERLAVTSRTAVVLMTHNYLRDLALLARLLPSSAFYLGILGPRHRTDRILADLRAEGHSLPNTPPPRLHSPVGLDIGADTPEQIALSIISEIQAVVARRSGSPLRERSGPIYAAEDVPSIQHRAEGRTIPTGVKPLCPLSAC